MADETPKKTPLVLVTVDCGYAEAFHDDDVETFIIHWHREIEANTEFPEMPEAFQQAFPTAAEDYAAKMEEAKVIIAEKQAEAEQRRINREQGKAQADLLAKVRRLNPGQLSILTQYVDDMAFSQTATQEDKHR